VQQGALERVEDGRLRLVASWRATQLPALMGEIERDLSSRFS
jgi:hypothetical protein